MVGIVVVLITTIAFGATRANTGRPPAPVASSPASPTPGVLHSPLTSPRVLLPAPGLPQLDQRIAALEDKYDAVLGITISQVAGSYRREQETWYGGTLRGGPSFGTIDVAMALAVLDGDRQPQDRNYMFNRSLADNSAAADEALWAFLGSDEEAAARTTAALRARGDYRTSVPHTSDDESEPPYARTNWMLAEQSQLAGLMICDYSDYHPVLAKLNDPAERPWGLQTIPLTYSKGSWGQVRNDRTLVRQFGLVQLQDGTRVGIAMVVVVDGTDPKPGRDAITELSNIVKRTASGFEAPNC